MLQPTPTLRSAIASIALAALSPLAAAQGGAESYSVGAPRSVFLSSPPGAAAATYCHPSNCKKKRRPVGFPNWSHTTNTGKPPRPIWVTVCLQSTFFPPLYKHFTLPPGGTVWSLINVPAGDWSWITTWVTDPYGEELGLYEMAHSFSELDENGVIVPDAISTTQAGPLDGLNTVESRVSVQPAEDGPWSVDRTYEKLPNGMRIVEDWNSATDPLVNQIVTTTVLHNASGYEQTCEVDRGKDGSIDHTSVVVYTELDSGDLRMDLEAFDGNGDLQSAFYALKQFQGQDSLMVTDIDSDGDGNIDQVDTETTKVVGDLRTMVIEHDTNADGLADQVETTTIEFRGLRDSSQRTTISDGGGVTQEVICIEMTPTFGGYLLDTLHDMDGDGTFDVRETQLSSVGPFADGVDEDYLATDSDNDGTYDVITHTAAMKSLDGTTYREVSATDARMDGVIEGFVSRWDDFLRRF